MLGKRTPPPGKEFLTDTARTKLDEEGAYLIDGVPAHLLPSYIPPKKPYSFTRMLDDILDFATRTLVDDGRLAFWMPVANENMDEEFPVPHNSYLELLHCCVQPFNKWSRRLLVYRRRTAEDVTELLPDVESSSMSAADGINGMSADDLNPFRRKYFRGFDNGEK